MSTYELPNPVARAAQVVGSRAAIARQLGITKGAVWQWEHGGRVPAEYCPQIERMTDGAVRCEDLRPDVDWAYLRNSRSTSSGAREAA